MAKCKLVFDLTQKLASPEKFVKMFNGKNVISSAKLF